ncbi:MAG: acyl-ACP--UDP-N-acetylglucosamine O-acyltransferase [Gammaproteobacteria bacterium]
MIDPCAIVDDRATIGEGVRIGPWSMIGPRVEIGPGTWVGPHVVIRGPTRIGRNNRIFQFSSIGDDAQDKKYRGEAEPRLEIGDGNTIREHCTLNRGTLQGGGVTRLGDCNWIMAYVHIAHDCLVGNHTVFANNASLAGHVVVDDHAVLGGFSAVHQYCRVGAHSFSAIATVITKDVPPYVLVSENPARAHGVNREGLRRNGFESESIEAIRRAYRVLYRQNLLLKEAIGRLEEIALECNRVAPLVDFLRQSSRGIVR